MSYFQDKISLLEDNLDSQGDLSKAGELILKLLDVLTDTIMEKNPDKLADAANYFGYLNYRFNRQIEEGRDFLLGQINAFYMISNQLSRGLADIKAVQAIKKSKYGFKILAAINERKLPTHKQLADAVGISPSQLSRTLKTIAAAGAVTFSDRGKQRFYLLTDIGKIILEREDRRQLLPQFLSLIKKADEKTKATLKDDREIAAALAEETAFTPSQTEQVIKTLRELRERRKITPFSSQDRGEVSPPPQLNNAAAETAPSLKMRSSAAGSKINKINDEIIDQLKHRLKKNKKS